MGTIFRFLTSASVLAVLLATAGASAQETQRTPRDAARRQPVQEGNAAPVNASPETAAGETIVPPGTIELDAISITATRQPTNVLDVPGTVTVTTRQQLDQTMTRDNMDLARYQPGITVDRQTSGTDPFGNLGGFTIRGVGGNRVQMQVDGTRIQERITDGNRSFVDFPGLKAVEIVRGPGSVLWGADALGGIVAYRTLDPDDLLKGKDKPYAGRIQATYDSFNKSFSKTAMAAFQLTPTLQGLILVNQNTYNEGKLSKARADGGLWGCPRVPMAIRCDTLNPLDGTTWNMLTKLVFRPSSDHEFKLTGELYDSSNNIRQMYDYGLQSTGAFNGLYPRNQDQTRKRVSLSHDWNVGVNFLDNLHWQLSYSPQSRDVHSERLQTLASKQNQVTVDNLGYSEEFWQADIQLTSKFNLGSSRHTLTYGFQGDYTRAEYYRDSLVKNLTTGRSTYTRSASFSNADTTRADFYLQDEISLLDGRLLITPGVRWANYAIDPKTNAYYIETDGITPSKSESSKLIPQIGAIFKLTDHYSVYARYAEGFKMPTAQQLYTSSPGVSFNLIPNPNLQPESVQSYEGGFRGQFNRAWFSIGGFYADYKDFIQNFYNPPGTNDYTYRNLSAVKIWGIEAFGEWQFHDNWAVNASASYQHGDQRYQAGDPMVPYDGATPFNGTVGLKWMRPDWGLQAEVISTFGQGVTRASSTDLFRPSSYMVFDSYVNWKPTEMITLRAGVLNIFDQRYFKGPLPYTFARTSTTAQAITNPLELQTAPGRTFKLSAQVDF
ncbi:TonB-dependent hemoglobin/transferrin/lactoferrin family receptor [Chelatococcus asaccharovorans]|uniref:Hemoglobin/transferrin/lactoferrin receptor protein n=1 Tax=Chelatococcus asaccharovorans TaxID=28210 RepID=A0A2V3TTF1_9HYPH|nr:TonB-dependent hemoglobin/transferrin/lactoferrin family receptor [Chelatococcus asaccharovorans]MBS7704903.1 TonB-dependent hemoglobin/transferrin/lactoferrin family receptor [Chelatococcus asaccharovorans]PXW51366.1 hemoglobin/transferrin/lactoferrin receptor protein [Chelatococcus asaccharovorans]